MAGRGDRQVRLHGGVEIPRLGLGVYMVRPGAPTRQAVAAALAAGYRHVDTARMYRNERDVGRAVRQSGIPRSEIFVTTKLQNRDHGYDRALRAFDHSLEALGLDYIDLYLIHWPVEGRRTETWKALCALLEDGRCRAIGVSNYTREHLEELLEVSPVRPAVNQVEFSPFLFQRGLLEFCAENDIQLEAYSPLTRGERLGEPVLRDVGRSHGKSPAQVLIRWALQHELVVIPKSARPERIRENLEVFDFELGDAEMARLDALDEGYRTCWDPTREP